MIKLIMYQLHNLCMLVFKYRFYVPSLFIILIMCFSHLFCRCVSLIFTDYPFLFLNFDTMWLCYAVEFLSLFFAMFFVYMFFFLSKQLFVFKTRLYNTNALGTPIYDRFLQKEVPVPSQLYDDCFPFAILVCMFAI